MQTEKTPLKKLREARGLTQAQVAHKLGIDQSTYHGIENSGGGRRENIEKIARFFGSAITELQIIFPERYPDYCVSETEPAE